jgi:uncharacterized protein YeeX (DUF496 family)
VVRVPSFIDAFKEFFRKWWSGYNNVAKDMAREIGFCVGVMGQGNFARDAGLFEWALKAIPLNDFRQLNLFTSVAYYINIDDVNVAEAKAFYDRVYYDFDSRDNPKLAVEKALEFAKSLKARFNVDAVVAFSGLHGAHVTVPLNKPIDWNVYARLWDVLIAPYDFKSIVDRKVREPKRIYRVPYTWNVKEDGTGFSYIIDLSGRRLKMEDFDWSNYEPLNPVDVVKIVEVSTPLLDKIIVAKPVTRYFINRNLADLPRDPVELDKNDAVPPCIRNIVDTFKKAGDVDHYARLVLVWYLKWVGYSIDDVVSIFSRFAKDFNERVTRYQVEYAYAQRGRREDWLPPSCKWMKQHNLCVNCGWGEKHGNIVTYTYARAKVPEDLKQKFFEMVKKAEGGGES